MLYAVFVSYVEAYNNSVYDLLDQKTLQSKQIRQEVLQKDDIKSSKMR